MDAITFFEEKQRMTKECTIECCKCPLSYENNEEGLACSILERYYGEIFFRCTDGTEIPVKEVRGLEGNGVLIIIMAQIIRKEDMQKMEQNIETRLGNGMRVIVLDERVKEIMRLEH